MQEMALEEEDHAEDGDGVACGRWLPAAHAYLPAAHPAAMQPSYYRWFYMVHSIFLRYLGLHPGGVRWGEIAREAEFFVLLYESSDEDASESSDEDVGSD